MNIRPYRVLVAPLAVCAVLAAGIALWRAGLRDRDLPLGVYLLANTIVFVDSLDFVLRLFAHRHRVGPAFGDSANSTQRLSIDVTSGASAPARPQVGIRPYAILVSVFNLESQLEAFIEALAPHRDRVWVISDGSTDHTVLRLRHAGWRCIDETENRHKPGAIGKLLEHLPAQIETVLVIDPDIKLDAARQTGAVSLERVIADFQQSGAAAACPRIRIERDGFIGRFQAFEYALAFGLGRKSLADYGITSGVSLYRREALQRALKTHSQSIYAEDLENALILLQQGEAIYYDGRLIVDTEGAGTWARWFSQRVGWYYGLLKVYVERFGEIRRICRRAPFAAYHYLGYMGLLSLGLHLLKVLSVLTLLLCAINGLACIFGLDPIRSTLANPVYPAVAAIDYCLFALVALFAIVPKGERGYAAPIIPLYFLYAMAQVVPMTVGFGNWVAMRCWGKRIYRDHYSPHDAAESLLARPRRPIPEAG